MRTGTTPSLDIRLGARSQRSFWVGQIKTYDFTFTPTDEEGAEGVARSLMAQVVRPPLPHS